MDIFKNIKLNPLLTYSFLISLTGISLGLLAQFILPPEIPLLYGLPQTENQLVSPIWIILPSVSSFAITVINLLLSMKINDNYLKKVLAVASIFTSILAIITTIKIVLLVGSI